MGQALLSGIVPVASGTLAERDALDPQPNNGEWFAHAEPPYDLTFWRKVPEGWEGPYQFRGAASTIPGPAGDGFNPAGAWDVDATYDKNDLVSHGPRSFVSFADGNTGNEPPDADEDDDHWQFVPAAVGPRGYTGDGWAAVLALAVDGQRRVYQVADWIGGTGDKPATGMFVGPSGYVETAAEAVDVRGPAGDGDGDVSGPDGGVTDGHLAVFDGDTGKIIKDGGAPFSGSYNDLSDRPPLGDVSEIDLPDVAEGKILDDSGNWVDPPESGGYDPNMALLALEMADLKGARMGMVGGVADPFDDESGVSTKTAAAYSAASDWYEPLPAVGPPISQSAGTVFGNMSENGGNAAAFDGVTNQANTSCAALTTAAVNTFAGYVGRSHASALSQVIVRGSNNTGYTFTGNPTVTLRAYGKQGAAPANATDGTIIGQISFTDATNESAGRTIDIEDRRTVWDHRWVALAANANPAGVFFAETIWHAAGDPDNMTLASVAYPAASEPDLGRVAVQLVEDDPITINDDVTAELSRDGGTSWSQATLALLSSLGSVKLYEDAAVDLSGQPAGDDVVWRVKTDNNVDVAVSGVVAQWR